MTTYYTNNPSRYGGCYATHNPSVSQAVVVAAPAAPTADVGGGRRLRTRIRIDGEIFEIDSRPEDVTRLVEMLRESAVEAAENQVAKDLVKPQRKPKPFTPKIELIRPQFQMSDEWTQQTQARLEAAQEMVRNTYLEMYARLALQQQDDEDIADILLLS